MSTLQSRQIRVFLSSTFRDMNAERDYLVNFIFPRIDDYCRQRYLEFTPIDLRWGIPEEDSRNGLVLRACLEEVDNSRPFFVGILGERYGWTPGEAELDALGASLQREQDWLLEKVVEGASITEMEIDYGVLRDMNIPHACFFLRAPGVEVPDDFKEPTGSVNEKRLMALKDKIRRQKKYGCYEYSTPKELGDRLYTELMAMIDSEYPPTNYDCDDALTVPHEMSLERRARTLCDITHYRGDFDKWIESLKKVFMVRSRAGGGSSTVLAYCVKDLRAYYSDNKIIYFDFESLPPVASPVDEFLKFMALERHRLPDDKWSMVAIDNASMLDTDDIERLIEWTDNQCNNVHVAFSVTIGSNAADMIGFRYSCPTSTLSIYDTEQRGEVIDNYTRQYGKRLTPAQKERIIKCNHTDDPTTMNILLESIVAHGRLETLDGYIDRLLKSTGVNDIFYAILSEGDKAFHSIGLGKEYAAATTAISLVPTGIPEKDMYESLNIPQTAWLTIRPFVMRFCKGNDNSIALTKSKWCRDVKMFWSTPYRAAAGKSIIDWYLADPERYARGARIAAAIYEDIWHLPIGTDTSDEAARTDLNRKMLGIALSPDLTKSIPTGALGLIFSLTMRDGIAKAGDVAIYGRKPDQLSPEEQHAYYSRLARVFTSFNRNADAAWCYERLYEQRIKSGDVSAPIYKARALLLVGKATEAIDMLKSSGLAGSKGLAGLFRKKADTGADLRNKINALAVMVRAYGALGQWDKMQNTGIDIEKAMDAIAENDLDKETVDNSVNAITEITLMLSMYGTAKACQQASEISHKMDDALKTMGLGHPAVYNDLLGCGIRELRRGEYKNAERWLREAINSAVMAFGSSYNNVLTTHKRSYQYNRAANLYGVVYYRLTGKYYDWDGVGYTTNVYKPLDSDRRLEGIDPATVDKGVKQTILLERDFYKNVVRTIQPPFKQQEMDAEPDELRKSLGL